MPILHQGNEPKFYNQLEINLSDYSKIEPLTCEATNSVSHATLTTTMNLTVIDPIAVRPASQAQPVAGESFSLQCAGSQNPASITWLKNKHPVLASERVRFSPDNTTMSFSPLLQTDDGLYQCVVAEGELPIQSVSYKMQVNYGPSSVVISEVDIVTVGKLYVFQCSASCYPTCKFTWTCGNVTSWGPELSLQVGELHPTQNLTCTAVNPATGMSVTAQKTLQVTAGPSNVQISGPAFMTAGVASNFTCSADCYPSCSYTWTVASGEENLSTAKGNTISVTPPPGTVISETLVCKAEDTVTLLSSSSSLHLWVANPFSVRPTSQGLPVAGESFSLQCAGSQNPASITWLKNKHPVLASERVRFSPDNTTMSFSPLLRADGGLYQCLVLEDGNHDHNNKSRQESRTPILSVGYLMHVNYGPDEVQIVKRSKGPVGEEMVVLTGSTTELQCLTDCFPVCSITWFYHDKFLSTNASILFTPVTPPYKAALTCVAFNSVTKENRTAETVVVVPEGPKNVVISGPDSLEIGVPASFTCSAECTPSCSFTWTVYGKNVTGSVIDISVNRHVSEESISCRAENTFTGKTAMISETLGVSDPHWCGC
ncbi:carcinoembryonic antigen-related cell adhesion molecule 20-like isoform X2 [Seriola dumerili]|uniref:carcinoembryonic antigen-related cell adhesion molecule 20-like isoform X2 n=1 Tax=Seriola dumerili TaxID=41447 RepID=UPI000BBED2B6|nr:carcinoembryonic antigen-related cell adhesion molecule 20-like isoform X2 [Seriola dumerili]